jgi:hypothetical protein
MRLLLFFSGLIWSICVFAQEPVVAVENPEYALLYRGYSNQLIPAVTHNAGAKVGLLGSKNLKISGPDAQNRFTVVPEGGRDAMVYVVLIKGKIVDTLKSISYRIAPLPSPTLFWGPHKHQSQANIREPRIFAKYTPEIRLNASFAVKSWQLIHAQDTIRGEGASLVSAQEFLQGIVAPGKIRMEVEVVGPDRETHSISGEWDVLPWAEEKDPEPAILCPG